MFLVYFFVLISILAIILRSNGQFLMIHKTQSSFLSKTNAQLYLVLNSIAFKQKIKFPKLSAGIYQQANKDILHFENICFKLVWQHN